MPDNNASITRDKYGTIAVSHADPKDDTTVTLEKKSVAVPQGKPITTSYSNSSFSQSEYLIYKESQCRLRYMLKMKFGY